MVKCDQQKSTNIYILRGREYMLTDILSPTALLLAQGVCAEDICVLAFTSRPNDSIRTSTIGSRSGTDRRGPCARLAYVTTPTPTCCRPTTVVSCRVAVTLQAAASGNMSCHVSM